MQRFLQTWWTLSVIRNQLTKNNAHQDVNRLSEPVKSHWLPVTKFWLLQPVSFHWKSIKFHWFILRETVIEYCLFIDHRQRASTQFVRHLKTVSLEIYSIDTNEISKLDRVSYETSVTNKSHSAWDYPKVITVWTLLSETFYNWYRTHSFCMHVSFRKVQNLFWSRWYARVKNIWKQEVKLASPLNETYNAISDIFLGIHTMS